MYLEGRKAGEVTDLARECSKREAVDLGEWVALNEDLGRLLVAEARGCQRFMTLADAERWLRTAWDHRCKRRPASEMCTIG